MPLRAIIKPVIYSEWRFSCACRAITISLRSQSRDRIFHRFGGFWRICFKNRSRVAEPLSVKTFIDTNHILSTKGYATRERKIAREKS